MKKQKSGYWARVCFFLVITEKQYLCRLKRGVCEDGSACHCLQRRGVSAGCLWEPPGRKLGRRRKTMSHLGLFPRWRNWARRIRTNQTRPLKSKCNNPHLLTYCPKLQCRCHWLAFIYLNVCTILLLLEISAICEECFHLAAFKLLTQLKLEKYNCSGFNVCNMHFFRYDFKRSVSHTSAHARCIVVSAQSST